VTHAEWARLVPLISAWFKVFNTAATWTLAHPPLECRFVWRWAPMLLARADEVIE
jgi:hypothetical protein